VGSRFTVLMMLVSVFALLMAMPAAFHAVHKGNHMPQFAMQLKEIVVAHAQQLSGDDVPVRLSSGADVSTPVQPVVRPLNQVPATPPVPATREAAQTATPSSETGQTVAVCPPRTYHIPAPQQPKPALTIGGGGRCLADPATAR
jgi:hypothetical protein